jgi:hypothetical protein
MTIQTMTSPLMRDQSSIDLLTKFFTDFNIHSIRITQDADIRDDEVSLVDISFNHDSADDPQTYQVTFKVLEQASGTHRYLQVIGPRPDFKLQLTEAGQGLGQAEICAVVRTFIAAINNRVAKVYKEQSILGTQPVGKTFVLYGKTSFKVLADNGEGQLTIRIIRKSGDTEAGLSANDLLDGLYSGVITQT